MSIHQDFEDLFRCLNKKNARYLVVGAHAVAYYSEPRYTKDIDVWIDPEEKNAENVYEALKIFGAPLDSLRIEHLTDSNMVFQIGIEPVRIDIMMGIGSIPFWEAWQNREESFFGNTKVYIIGSQELMTAKKESNRAQDKIDLEKLRKSRNTKNKN